MIARMDRLGPRGIDAYFPLNLSFHDQIVAYAGNRKLLLTYRRVINEMHLLRRQGLARGGGLDVSNDEHRAIIDALERRDVARVTVAMREHVLAGARRMSAAFEKDMIFTT
jgi:DNA-binding GntR family transcriptional regulator